jgi:soluble lytic murein transglycosylase-like protein
MILFWLKRTTTLGLLLAAATVAQAGPVVEKQQGPSAKRAARSSESFVTRRYEVREDASGRLVRVLASSRRSAKASGAGDRRAGNTVVQGRSAPTSSKGSLGKVDIEALIREAGRRHDVDPELIRAVIRQESNYDLFAVSPKGACGLMQLMPGTALRFGVSDIFDPAENVEGGVKYLRHLMDRYEGDRTLILAAYNAGEGAVDSYGGVPPYTETTDYVERVSGFYASMGGSVSKEPAEAERSRITTRVEASGLIVFEME